MHSTMQNYSYFLHTKIFFWCFFMSEIQTFESISEYRTLECNIFKCEEKVTKIWHSTDLSIEFGNFFAHLLMMLCCLWGVPLVVHFSWLYRRKLPLVRKYLAIKHFEILILAKKVRKDFNFPFLNVMGHLI